MNCTDVRNLLPSLLYSDVSADEKTALRLHLSNCPACNQEWNSLQRLPELLDAPPVPSFVVDTTQIYQLATKRERQRLRRWRGAAAILGAAAVILFAVGLVGIEVRVQSHQFVVRWGPGVESTPDLSPALRHDPRDQSATLAAGEDVLLLKELVRALAIDVEVRDQQQRQVLSVLQARLADLQWQDQRRWAATERSVAALYTAQFGASEKGEKP